MSEKGRATDRDGGFRSFRLQWEYRLLNNLMRQSVITTPRQSNRVTPFYSWGYMCHTKKKGETRAKTHDIRFKKKYHSKQKRRITCNKGMGITVPHSQSTL